MSTFQHHRGIWKEFSNQKRRIFSRATRRLSAIRIHSMGEHCITKWYLKLPRSCKRSTYHRYVSIFEEWDTAREPMTRDVEKWTMRAMHWSFSADAILV